MGVGGVISEVIVEDLPSLYIYIYVAWFLLFSFCFEFAVDL